MAFTNSINKSNISENWLFQLGYANGDAQGNGDGAWSVVTQANGEINRINETSLTVDEVSIVVDDETVFQVGDYISINNEVMYIYYIPTDGSKTIAVHRGQMGTTATVHNNNNKLSWSNFLPIAFSDTTSTTSVNDALYNTVFYHGTVLNRPSIRESINLVKSTSSTSNLTVVIPDFEYKGSPVSKELFGGNHKYINQEIRIFCQIDNEKPTQIGSFRLINIETDAETISLSFISHRPWDFIKVPQDKTFVSNQYVPLVYGDYTPNDSFFNTPAFCDTKLYPVPMLGVDETVIRTIMPRSYASTSNSHINMFQGGDVFLPLMSSSGVENDTTKLVENVNCLETLTSRLACGRVFASESRSLIDDSHTEFSNTHLAFDKDTSTASTVAISEADSHVLAFSVVNRVYDTHGVYNVRIRHKYEHDASINAYIFAGSGSAIATASVSFSADTFVVTSFDITATTPNVGKLFNIIYIKASGSNGTLSVGSVKVDIKTAFDATDKDEIKELGTNKFWYSGGNGLKDAWSDTAAVTDIHEAHRDLLVRFAGLDTADPDGWDDGTSSDLASDRSGWSIRWWALEPVELQKTLEQMQYEGCFIFRYKYDGSPQYIHIKNSPTADYILSLYDIEEINISSSPYSELITKRTINYEKHPAESRYLKTLTVEDTTNNPRKKWNILSKENIEEVTLSMLTAKVTKNSDDTDTNPGNDDPNDSFSAYYNNIFGDIKLIVSCVVVNPKYYPIEVGDVIEFDENNMHPPTPMGYNSANWDGLKMMVVSTNRTPSKLLIEAREI